MNYHYWKAALAGEKPKMFVDQPELGFYRKGIYERNDKGLNKRVGWAPVAVYMDGDTMIARVGPGAPGTWDVVGDKLNELWTYIAGNPISEDWYRAVAEQDQPWPDAHDPSKNELKEAVRSAKYKLDSGETDEQKLAREIAEARAGVSQYEKIDSDTMAGQALSLKNEITAKAGQLDKIRESLVRPHVDAQAEINGRLNPIIKDAKTEGAKLLRSIGSWEDQKRAIARAAQERADREAKEHAERIRKAEQEGKPVNILPPAPVVSNAPPPSTQVAAAVGRKASVKVAKFVVDIDLDNAFVQFRNEIGLKLLLIDFAQKAVNAGLTVEGATIEERSIVR